MSVDCQLGLHFGDTIARGVGLDILAAGDLGRALAIDQVPAAAQVDRLVADPERLGDLLGRKAGLGQVQNLAADLGRIERGIERSQDAESTDIRHPDTTRAGHIKTSAAAALPQGARRDTGLSVSPRSVAGRRTEVRSLCSRIPG